MCKVLLVTGITESDKMLEFMKAAEPEMTNGNTDGIGYSAINSKNELFMEKWHNNRHFLQTGKGVVDQKLIEDLGALQDRLDLKVNYMNYGNITRDDLRTVTMHTRYATCGRTMENTHPFVDQETSLIHNGVIYNDRQLNNKKISTCDSESALQLYLSKEASKGVKSVYQSFLDDLEGYWAFGILAKNQSGTYMLDVIKGGAQLYFAYVPELGTNCIMFATSREIILSAVKKMNFAVPKIENLIDKSLSRFNAVSGVLIDNLEFKAAPKKEIPKYTPTDYSSARNKFLNQGGVEKKDVALIKFDADLAVNGTSLGDSEINFIDEMTSTYGVLEALDEVDQFQGSNYATFFDSLPTALQNAMERQKDMSNVTLSKLIQVIDVYNESTSLAAAFTTLNKKASA